jgi:hypothetical protein
MAAGTATAAAMAAGTATAAVAELLNERSFNNVRGVGVRGARRWRSVTAIRALSVRGEG